jgi:glycosyltransferase involved in cell wall biosynthesis
MTQLFLSVIVPAYNEEELLGQTIQQISSFLCARYPEHEIIVVNDGSTDSTSTIIESLRQRVPRLRSIDLPRNLGKGSAVRAGIRAAEGEWVVVADADLETPIDSLLEFFEVQSSTGAMVVIGSKRHPRSQVQYPLTRRILSRGYNSLVQLGFQLPLSDTQASFKLFHRNALNAVSSRLLVKRFAYDVELLSVLHRQGFAITEAPIRNEFRRLGIGRIRASTILNVTRETAGVWYRLNIKHWYDPVLAQPALDRGWSLDPPTNDQVVK